MSNTIKKLISKNISFCDVGARWGLSEPWNEIKNCLDVVYFEPDAEEFNKLKLGMNEGDLGFDCALYSSSKKVVLNLTSARECSSLLEPNNEVIRNYPNELAEMYQIEKKVSVLARSLDDIASEGGDLKMDFLKLDVQGAELEILKGGASFLNKNLLGIEIEVEFQELYKNQPLFSDIDSYVRKNLNLVLFDISKHYSKYKIGANKFSKKGQLIFGDVLYMRSPSNLINWCSEMEKTKASNKIVSACIIGYLYGYLDYSLTILNEKGISKFLDDIQIKELKRFLMSKSKNFTLEFKGSSRIYNFFNFLGTIFKRTHNGWASFEGRGNLGSRKKFGVYQ